MSLIRGFPNVKFLTRELNDGGKLRERMVMGRGVQAGYNGRSSFRVPFAKEKGRNERQWGADKPVERDIFIGSYAGVDASRFVISAFPKARKRER